METDVHYVSILSMSKQKINTCKHPHATHSQWETSGGLKGIKEETENQVKTPKELRSDENYTKFKFRNEQNGF